MRTAKRFLCATMLTCAVGIWPASVRPQQTTPFVTIGQLDWMTRNLSVVTFQNGDPIPRVDRAVSWAQAGRIGRPALTNYPTSQENLAAWGRLYNYYAVVDPRGICPIGWRVPTDSDWMQLEATVGAPVAASRLRAREGWPSSAQSRDDVGFSAPPAGFRTQRGEFFLGDRVAYFWSSTSLGSDETTAHMLFDYDDKIFRIVYSKAMGMSVRCVRPRIR